MTTRAISLCTFIDDDGNEEVWTVLKDLYEAQGEPFCAALISGEVGNTGYITAEQALALQNASSVDFEVLSHSTNTTQIPTLSDEDKITAFIDSKAALTAMGLNVESFVFPSNQSDASSKLLVADYYRSAASAAGYNTSPLDYYALARRQVDTDTPLATLTGWFDTANAARGWMIFYTHGYDMDAAVQSKLNSLIDHVQSAGVPIVTVSEALDRLENTPLGTIQLRGTPQGGGGVNGADVTLTFDETPQENDVVIVFGGHGDAVTTITAPGSGYTEVFKNEGTKPICGIWYKVMGSSPDTNVVCSGGGHVNDAVGYGAIVLSGVDTSNVLDTAIQSTAGSTPAQPDSPAITTVTDGAWVFSIGLNSAADTAVVEPIGYSTDFGGGGNDINDFSAFGSYLEIANASEEDPSAYTFWASDEWYAVTLAIRPLIVVPNIVGETQSAADAALVAVGLVSGTVTTAYSDSVASGLVISQDPAASAMGAVGSSVNYVVSLGADQPTTGGWLNEYNAYKQRAKEQARRRKEILTKVRELDGIDGEIAELMQLDQAREDEDKRIAEFRALLETEISKAELDRAGLLNKRINRAYDRAMKKATFSAIEALEREIEDAIEEEEFAFLVLTLN